MKTFNELDIRDPRLYAIYIDILKLNNISFCSALPSITSKIKCACLEINGWFSFLKQNELHDCKISGIEVNTDQLSLWLQLL